MDADTPGHPQWDPDDYAWDGVNLTASRTPKQGPSASSAPTAYQEYLQDDVPMLMSRPPVGALSKLQLLVCQVQGCKRNLQNSKLYYQRFKLCEVHLKCPAISIDGVLQRLCQQCGRFHELSAFEGKKRTCRAQLDRIRRNKERKRQTGGSSSDSPDRDMEPYGGEDTRAADAGPGARRRRKKSGPGAGAGGGGGAGVRGASSGTVAAKADEGNGADPGAAGRRSCTSGASGTPSDGSANAAAGSGAATGSGLGITAHTAAAMDATTAAAIAEAAAALAGSASNTTTHALYGMYGQPGADAGPDMINAVAPFQASAAGGGAAGFGAGAGAGVVEHPGVAMAGFGGASGQGDGGAFAAGAHPMSLLQGAPEFPADGRTAAAAAAATRGNGFAQHSSNSVPDTTAGAAAAAPADMALCLRPSGSGASGGGGSTTSGGRVTRMGLDAAAGDGASTGAAMGGQMGFLGQPQSSLSPPGDSAAAAQMQSHLPGLDIGPGHNLAPQLSVAAQRQPLRQPLLRQHDPAMAGEPWVQHAPSAAAVGGAAAPAAAGSGPMPHGHAWGPGGLMQSGPLPQWANLPSSGQGGGGSGSSHQPQRALSLSHPFLASSHRAVPEAPLPLAPAVHPQPQPYPHSQPNPHLDPQRSQHQQQHQQQQQQLASGPHRTMSLVARSRLQVSSVGAGSSSGGGPMGHQHGVWAGNSGGGDPTGTALNLPDGELQSILDELGQQYDSGGIDQRLLGPYNLAAVAAENAVRGTASALAAKASSASQDRDSRSGGQSGGSPAGPHGGAAGAGATHIMATGEAGSGVRPAMVGATSAGTGEVVRGRPVFGGGGASGGMAFSGGENIVQAEWGSGAEQHQAGGGTRLLAAVASGLFRQQQQQQQDHTHALASSPASSGHHAQSGPAASIAGSASATMAPGPAGGSLPHHDSQFPLGQHHQQNQQQQQRQQQQQQQQQQQTAHAMPGCSTPMDVYAQRMGPGFGNAAGATLTREGSTASRSVGQDASPGVGPGPSCSPPGVGQGPGAGTGSAVSGPVGHGGRTFGIVSAADPDRMAMYESVVRQGMADFAEPLGEPAVVVAAQGGYPGAAGGGGGGGGAVSAHQRHHQAHTHNQHQHHMQHGQQLQHHQQQQQQLLQEQQLSQHLGLQRKLSQAQGFQQPQGNAQQPFAGLGGSPDAGAGAATGDRIGVADSQGGFGTQQGMPHPHPHHQQQQQQQQQYRNQTQQQGLSQLPSQFPGHQPPQPSQQLQLQHLAQQQYNHQQNQQNRQQQLQQSLGRRPPQGHGSETIGTSGGGLAAAVALAAREAMPYNTNAVYAVPYIPRDTMTRVTIKLMNCLPDDLPRHLRANLQQWVNGGTAAEVLQACLRPGCLELVVDVVHTSPVEFTSMCLAGRSVDQERAAIRRVVTERLAADNEIVVEVNGRVLVVQPGNGRDPAVVWPWEVADAAFRERDGGVDFGAAAAALSRLYKKRGEGNATPPDADHSGPSSSAAYSCSSSSSCPSSTEDAEGAGRRGDAGVPTGLPAGEQAEAEAGGPGERGTDCGGAQPDKPCRPVIQGCSLVAAWNASIIALNLYGNQLDASDVHLCARMGGQIVRLDWAKLAPLRRSPPPLPPSVSAQTQTQTRSQAHGSEIQPWTPCTSQPSTSSSTAPAGSTSTSTTTTTTTTTTASESQSSSSVSRVAVHLQPTKPAGLLVLEPRRGRLLGSWWPVLVVPEQVVATELNALAEEACEAEAAAAAGDSGDGDGGGCGFNSLPSWMTSFIVDLGQVLDWVGWKGLDPGPAGVPGPAGGPSGSPETGQPASETNCDTWGSGASESVVLTAASSGGASASASAIAVGAAGSRKPVIGPWSGEWGPVVPDLGEPTGGLASGGSRVLPSSRRLDAPQYDPTASQNSAAASTHAGSWAGVGSRATAASSMAGSTWDTAGQSTRSRRRRDGASDVSGDRALSTLRNAEISLVLRLNYKACRLLAYCIVRGLVHTASMIWNLLAAQEVSTETILEHAQYDGEGLTMCAVRSQCVVTLGSVLRRIPVPLATREASAMGPSGLSALHLVAVLPGDENEEVIPIGRALLLNVPHLPGLWFTMRGRSDVCGRTPAQMAHECGRSGLNALALQAALLQSSQPGTVPMDQLRQAAAELGLSDGSGPDRPELPRLGFTPAGGASTGASGGTTGEGLVPAAGVPGPVRSVAPAAAPAAVAVTRVAAASSTDGGGGGLGLGLGRIAERLSEVRASAASRTGDQDRERFGTTTTSMTLEEGSGTSTRRALESTLGPSRRSHEVTEAPPSVRVAASPGVAADEAGRRPQQQRGPGTSTVAAGSGSAVAVDGAAVGQAARVETGDSAGEAGGSVGRTSATQLRGPDHPVERAAAAGPDAPSPSITVTRTAPAGATVAPAPVQPVLAPTQPAFSAPLPTAPAAATGPSCQRTEAGRVIGASSRDGGSDASRGGGGFSGAAPGPHVAAGSETRGSLPDPGQEADPQAPVESGGRGGNASGSGSRGRLKKLTQWVSKKFSKG